MESRRGLSSDPSRAFRAAVALTKTDPAAACDGWDEIGQATSGHVSTEFNRGLCAEMLGRFDVAEGQYRRVLELSPREAYAISGLERIDARRRADRQLALHRGE